MKWGGEGVRAAPDIWDQELCIIKAPRPPKIHVLPQWNYKKQKRKVGETRVAQMPCILVEGICPIHVITAEPFSGPASISRISRECATQAASKSGQSIRCQNQGRYVGGREG